ncbi:hypothetical protein ANANG_G00228970 [Anguilla anguilla]|uniref:FBA domain-containing protein n=1 Tax=Anguilla anguilla TaxID=7936 RepID=A0A9D3RTG2_ANGAN|nr:hypothetical protein ANANG_G00228970 [Anguilla anguilla]
MGHICIRDVACAPPPVLEKVFVNVPPEEVVCGVGWCAGREGGGRQRRLVAGEVQAGQVSAPRHPRPPLTGGSFYFLCKNRRNLIKNPIAIGGTCKKSQLIDLVKEGYSQLFMDEIQPDIVISDWYSAHRNCGSKYEICVELLSQNEEVIRKFCPEPVYIDHPIDRNWRQMTHVFRDYGRGVRFVRFCHGGQDTKFWAGWYGIRVTNSSVEICPSAPV